MNLVGAWVMDEADAQALAKLGNVLLEFGDGGGLIYTIRSQEKDQIIMLQYKIEGSTIVTNQPSKPRFERTQFSLADNILTLEFDGAPYRFVRVR
jgi:hypothetical protein